MTVELSHLQVLTSLEQAPASLEQELALLIIFLNFEEVLCIGNPDNSVRSLNKSSDSFEYVFFELYLLVINSIKSSSTFWLTIISESLVTTNLLNPVNWFKSIVRLPYLPSSVSLLVYMSVSSFENLNGQV